MSHYDPWIESHVNLSDHPKVHDLARTLSVLYPYAIGTLHLLWWYGMRFAWRDGDLSRYGADAIEAACRWSGTRGTLIKCFQDCGFLNGLKIHDWSDFTNRLVKDRLRYEQQNRKRTKSVRNTDVLRRDYVANRTVPDLTVPNQITSKSKERVRTLFQKPTFEQILEFVKIQGLAIDSRHCFDYYESNGWRVGKNPMRDWKAAIRNWARRDQNGTGTSNTTGHYQGVKPPAGKYDHLTER